MNFRDAMTEICPGGTPVCKVTFSMHNSRVIHSVRSIEENVQRIFGRKGFSFRNMPEPSTWVWDRKSVLPNAEVLDLGVTRTFLGTRLHFTLQPYPEKRYVR